MSRTQYEKVIPSLRDALLAAQKRLHDEKPFALAVVVTGLPAAGRSEIVNEFLEWLDPKHIQVRALQKLRRSSRAWPAMWRYWNALPARGEIAFFFMGWYEDLMRPALRRSKGTRQDLARAVQRIRQFESMLPRDGVRILKLHLTVDEAVQKDRIRKLREDKLTRWRVTHEERWLARHYDQVQAAAQSCMEATNQPGVEWCVVDGTDPQSRSFAAGKLLLDALEEGFSGQLPKFAKRKAMSVSGQVLSGSHPGERLDDDAYDEELERLRGRFALLTRRSRFRQHGAVLAFEGMDAAGKGGAIRRLTSALDARQYSVVPISAPTPEERSYPYLWRFWRRVPQQGEIAIFDRSWYGRVLVERVRGFASPPDWQRAYDEINEFEQQLVEHGLIVHKFWLQVSKDEQLQRFQERDHDTLKRYKVDPEDWKNRRHYDDYQIAAREMIRRTSVAAAAPWTVVEADDKKYARLKVLRTVCEAIERALD
ncbi:polyphosphate:AMP phosphotransferase [Povalibacter sp.]|uniref:polyphosphate:AMP phosphotransferase n=1 Tax=Povalibacter sp. TaxID=1962978 RepID=UPI002F3EA819